MFGTLCEEYLELRCRELPKTEKGTMGRNTMPKFKDKKVSARAMTKKRISEPERKIQAS